jgi:hypothetical protein
MTRPPRSCWRALPERPLKSNRSKRTLPSIEKSKTCAHYEPPTQLARPCEPLR